MKWIKRLLCIAVIGLIVYSGIMLGMPQFRYHSLKSDVQGIIKFTTSDEEIKKAILEAVKESGAPINESDIIMTKTEQGWLAVKITWSETVDILGAYQRKFDFVIEAQSG